MTRKNSTASKGSPAAANNAGVGGYDGVRLTRKQGCAIALITAVALGGTFVLAGGSPGIWAFFLFLLFPLAAAVATLVRALRPARGRILFLRRFHTERPPNFPVSRLMSLMDRHGYEVVTLADTLVRKDPDRPFMMILCIVLAVCISFVGTLLPIMTFALTPFVAGATLQIVTLGMIAERPMLYMEALITAAATIAGTIFWARTLRPWRRARRTAILEKVLTFLLRHAPGGWKDWSKLSAAQLDRAAHKRIRGRFGIGLVVIRCSNENWHRAIENLVRSSIAVCIDISNPSEHIQTEVALVAAHAGRRVIWLRQEDAASPFLNGPFGGYSIFRHDFAGARFDFPYPPDPQGLLHAQFAQARIALEPHAKRLLALLQALNGATGNSRL